MIGYEPLNQLGQGTTIFVDMFSYETYGAKTNPMTLGRMQTATGDLDVSYVNGNVLRGSVPLSAQRTKAIYNVPSVD